MIAGEVAALGEFVGEFEMGHASEGDEDGEAVGEEDRGAGVAEDAEGEMDWGHDGHPTMIAASGGRLVGR